MKIAWKNVFAAKGEYACFFAALILVQLLFGISGLVYCNNNRIGQEYVEENYDYHFSLNSLSDMQFYYLQNAKTAEQQKNWIFDIVRYRERKTSGGKSLYDVDILLLEDSHSCYDAFFSRYGKNLDEDGRYTVTKTPLLYRSEELSAARADFGGTVLLCTALSFFLLTMLYRIKLNHFKFTYGIYLSFGADFKGLCGTALSEMLVISALTALPSILLSYLLAALLYLPAGGLHGFFVLPALILLVGSTLSSLLAVLLPVRRISRGVPVKMLLAEDNSNLVSSPRYSTMLMKKRSVFSLEGLSIFRFRRYFAGLLLSASVFGMLFVTGAFLSDSRKEAEKLPIPRYAFDFSGSSYTAESVLDTLLSMEGVQAAVRQKSLSAASLNSNILVPADRLAFSSGFVSYQRNPSYKGSMQVKYSSADAYALSLIDDFYGYSYVGDLSLLTKDPASYVVVNDAVKNRKVTNLKPGDKLLVSVECSSIRFWQSREESFGFDTSVEDNDLLLSYFETCDFTYREFTVAAVISGAPSDGRLDLLFAPDTFQEITGQSPSAKNLSLYLDPALTKEQTAAVDDAILDLSCRCAGIQYSTTDAAGEKLLATQKNTFGFYLTLSALLFLVCPLIWFFSQSLFYSKRKLEFDVFRTVGMVTKGLRRSFLTDGGVLAAFAAILYSLLSYGAVTLCCHLLNRGWFQSLCGVSPSVYRYTVHLPLWAYLPGLLLTIAFAFGASAFALLRYQRKINVQSVPEFDIESH